MGLAPWYTPGPRAEREAVGPEVSGCKGAWEISFPELDPGGLAGGDSWPCLPTCEECSPLYGFGAYRDSTPIGTFQPQANGVGEHPRS